MNDQLTLGDWAPPLRPELSQYHTPVILARKMVEWAGVRAGDRVLEPSAGGGNIVREALALGANVTAIEIDPAWSRLLEEEFPEAGVYTADFRTVSPVSFLGSFHVAIMNPPLDAGQGPYHVAHGLRLAPVVVSLLRTADLNGKEHHDCLWSRCDFARLAVLKHRPVFVGKGGSTDFAVVEVRRPGTHHEPQAIEHWTERWNA